MNRDDIDADYHNHYNWPWAANQQDIPEILSKLTTVPMIHINISLTWTAELLQLLYTMLHLPWSEHVWGFYRSDTKTGVWFQTLLSTTTITAGPGLMNTPLVQALVNLREKLIAGKIF